MSARRLPYTVLDAFVVDGKAFTGNPAAVYVFERGEQLDDRTLQLIARRAAAVQQRQTSSVLSESTISVRLAFSGRETKRASMICGRVKVFGQTSALILFAVVHAGCGGATLVQMLSKILLASY